MGHVSPYLRKIEGGYSHWCPGCKEMHAIPDSWAFNGDHENPTFTPSVKITGKLRVLINGEWTGEWVRDAAGKPIDYCCHYNLTAGKLQFHGDCTHALSGASMTMSDLPPVLRD